MENSLAARILASLGIVVLKRVNESHFKIVGTIPEWFSNYFQHQNLEVEKLLPGTLFPFIETFLFDAEDFWNSNSRNILKSDLWSESDTEGNEIHLGASALCLEGEKVLLIQLLSETYEEKQLLLQQLREDRLSYDQKLKEMRAEVLAGTKSSDLKGEVLADRYQLQSVLGQGGLGIVYKAYDRQTKGFVAVKLLIEKEDTDTNFYYQRFDREIKILRRIDHPSIVSIIDSGITDTGRPYLVMEFVEGSTVDKLQQEERIWPIGRILNLLRDICPALAYIHKQNIIHRDLKPANIMVQPATNGETAKLLDLGIAKMLHSDSESMLAKTLTRKGSVVGTLQYLAPEQCLGSNIDQRTDLYALGTIVYELIAGDLPFYADSLNGWLVAHLQENPTPLRDLNPTITKEVEAVVHKTLEKRPSNRPSSVMEFLDSFELAARNCGQDFWQQGAYDGKPTLYIKED